MRRLGSVRELHLAIQSGEEEVTLQIKDISIAFSDEDEVYLFVSKDMDFKVPIRQWKIVRNYMVNYKGQYFKDLPKYQHFYQ